MNHKNLIQNLSACLLLCFSLACTAAPTIKPSGNFQIYWHQFRTASLNNDYAALAHLTKLPLPVKNSSDNRTITTYQANELTKIFPKLLAQVVYQHQGGNLTKTTLEEAIRTKEKVNYDAKDKSIRVEQLEFKLIEGKWFLTKAYLEE